MLNLFIILTLFPNLITSVLSTSKVGIPGTECLFGGICSGGSICIDSLCLCVDGQREWNSQCIESQDYLNRADDTNNQNPPTIGLAGRPCGRGGVCRPSTKCISGVCKCRQGYNPSFGECIRDLSVPRHIPREFVPDNRSILRFPS